MEEGIAELLMSSPICEEATMMILSSGERHAGEAAETHGEAGMVAGALHRGRRAAHAGLDAAQG